MSFGYYCCICQCSVQYCDSRKHRIHKAEKESVKYKENCKICANINCAGYGCEANMEKGKKEKINARIKSIETELSKLKDELKESEKRNLTPFVSYDDQFMYVMDFKFHTTHFVDKFPIFFNRYNWKNSSNSNPDIKQMELSREFSNSRWILENINLLEHLKQHGYEIYSYGDSRYSDDF